jgi:hypothetical protein
MNYWENKSIIEKNFELASKFIDDLENNERRQKGFNIGIYTNLHFYLNDWFLFRIEFVGYDAIKFDFRPRKVPNKKIKSIDFLLVVRKVISESNLKQRRDFYEESIIIRNVNSYYLELVNQAIDKFYNQELIKTINQNSNNEVIEQEPTKEIPQGHCTIEFNTKGEQKLNIRKSSGIDVSYFKINREERNLCAILFHTLLISDNLKLFLNKIDCYFPIIDSEKSIYLEYAFIRDIWENIRIEYGITEGNNIKKKIILDALNLSNTSDLKKMSISNFNEFFVQSMTRKPSSDEIESPGNWSVVKFDGNVQDNAEFLNICKFKWSFNAKPDIVINTSNNQAICIEGKFKSGEGIYPTNSTEKEIFHRRNLAFVGQLAIQPVIMNLLNIEAKYILLTNNKIYSNTHVSYTWKEIFNELDISQCPAFIKEWINRDDIN